MLSACLCFVLSPVLIRPENEVSHRVPVLSQRKYADGKHETTYWQWFQRFVPSVPVVPVQNGRGKKKSRATAARVEGAAEVDLRLKDTNKVRLPMFAGPSGVFVCGPKRPHEYASFTTYEMLDVLDNGLCLVCCQELHPYGSFPSILLAARNDPMFSPVLLDSKR